MGNGKQSLTQTCGPIGAEQRQGNDSYAGSGQVMCVCVRVQMVPMAMYFGYMFIVSYSFFCLTGTIGFFACLIFCKKIYSAVKID